MDANSAAMATDNSNLIAGIIGSILGFGAIAFIILFVVSFVVILIGFLVSGYRW